MTYLLRNAETQTTDAMKYIYLKEMIYDELIIYAKSITQDGEITVDADFDDSAYDVPLLAATTLTAAAAPTTLRLTERYPFIRISYRNDGAGANTTITIGYAIKGAPH